MPLIKEDGTGLANANTYANVADADAYHLPNSHDVTWTSASTTNKEKALEIATRFIDGAWQFNGRKLTTLQALQWPRVEAPDYDTGEDFASNALPADLVKATCEMAREAILLDRTAARTDEGLLQLTITGALHLLFDKKDSRGILTDFAKLLLSRLGYSKQSGTGSRPILRV